MTDERGGGAEEAKKERLHARRALREEAKQLAFASFGEGASRQKRTESTGDISKTITQMPTLIEQLPTLDPVEILLPNKQRGSPESVPVLMSVEEDEGLVDSPPSPKSGRPLPIKSRVRYSEPVNDSESWEIQRQRDLAILNQTENANTYVPEYSLIELSEEVNKKPKQRIGTTELIRRHTEAKIGVAKQNRRYKKGSLNKHGSDLKKAKDKHQGNWPSISGAKRRILKLPKLLATPFQK
jgi:hypothetical protein